MAHRAQYQYVQDLKERFPDVFEEVDVLCVGSMDINSTSRGMRIDLLFEGGSHIGLDLGEGPGVDVVCKGHEYDPGRQFDVVYSCECFEHDKHWPHTLRNMIRLTRPGGFLFFTCATTGRPEHGTTRTSPQDSPFTNDYYRNLKATDVIEAVPEIVEAFEVSEFSVHEGHKDLQFWGRKQ